MNYWQVGCGAEGRDYAEEFLRYGMAFVGGSRNVSTMRSVMAGDRVVMKRGMSRIVAVGTVVPRDGVHRGEGDKEWLHDFDGWDLSAYCFVSWHVPPKPMATRGLTRGTIQRVHTDAVIKVAEEIVREHPEQADVEDEPEPTKKVTDDDLIEFLIRHGLRPADSEKLTAAFTRIRRLATFYYRGQSCDEGEFYWEDVREHETRTFLIVPLLLALGWSEQQIKIELPVARRQRADIACFSRPFRRNDGECALIVESKGLSQGLTYARDQARSYAAHFSNCRTVVVSNGFCYKAFVRDESGTFLQTPTAYLNLRDPRDRYPLDPRQTAGALEALRLLLPSTVLDS